MANATGKLAGKVAVVTGGSKGIGAAIVERLVTDGASVVFSYSSSADAANRLIGRLNGNGRRAIAVQADVRNASETQKLFDQAINEFGRVNILVNNAGVFEGKPILDFTPEHYAKHFDVNVRGVLHTTQQAVRAFGGDGGSIINISSVVATSPQPNFSVYSATKGAVDAITKSLASELGPKKILVNSVSPGATETEGFHAMEGSSQLSATFAQLTPLGRMGKPDEIASVVSFLASEDAGWITGQIIPVSGGIRT